MRCVTVGQRVAFDLSRSCPTAPRGLRGALVKSVYPGGLYALIEFDDGTHDVVRVADLRGPEEARS